MVIHVTKAWYMFTQGFYGIYSMIFERIKNEDDQFRDNSDDDEDIPKFGKPMLQLFVILECYIVSYCMHY